MLITDRDIFLDFETRSRAKLDKVGPWRYAQDPSTKILCLSYAIGFKDPEIWIEGQPPPKILMAKIKDRSTRIHGWNAMGFERAIFELIAGPKLGWEKPTLEQYYDTQHDALALALPAALGDCCDALKLKDSKDKEGKRLIKFLCQPISSGKKKGLFREREHHLEDYCGLYDYCKKDVIAERGVYMALPFHVQGFEREVSLMTARINERGVPIDILAVEKIAAAIEEEKADMCVRFERITGLDSPTKRGKFLVWLNDNGLEIGNTQAETIRDILAAGGVPSHIEMALFLAHNVTKTSNAKYASILRSLCSDGTVKNNLIYHKANTGRFAGAGFQIQNLPSACEPEPEPLVQLFIDEELDFIRLWRGILETASQLVRSMIKAKAGTKFLNGDLKGIEARGTCWATQEWDILEAMGKGMDTYKITAAKMYNTTYELISKVERQAGKICVLAGGFGGAEGAIMRMARKMNIPMELEEARKHTKDFRKGRKKLVQTWYAFGDAAIEAMENPGTYCSPTYDNVPDRRFKFQLLGSYLYLILPSGRRLSFPFPKIKEEYFRGYKRKNVHAMWVDSYSHQWQYRNITGANFFQSAVQALCRDILMEAHLRVEAEGMPLIMSVHDEGTSVVPDDVRYTVEEYNRLMCVRPVWAQNFPLAADCWEGYRFKK